MRDLGYNKSRQKHCLPGRKTCNLGMDGYRNLFCLQLRQLHVLLRLSKPNSNRSAMICPTTALTMKGLTLWPASASSPFCSMEAIEPIEEKRSDGRQLEIPAQRNWEAGLQKDGNSWLEQNGWNARRTAKSQQAPKSPRDKNTEKTITVGRHRKTLVSLDGRSCGLQAESERLHTLTTKRAVLWRMVSDTCHTESWCGRGLSSMPYSESATFHIDYADPLHLRLQELLKLKRPTRVATSTNQTQHLHPSLGLIIWLLLEGIDLILTYPLRRTSAVDDARTIISCHFKKVNRGSIVAILSFEVPTLKTLWDWLPRSGPGKAGAATLHRCISNSTRMAVKPPRSLFHIDMKDMRRQKNHTDQSWPTIKLHCSVACDRKYQWWFGYAVELHRISGQSTSLVSERFPKQIAQHHIHHSWGHGLNMTIYSISLNRKPRDTGQCNQSISHNPHYPHSVLTLFFLTAVWHCH